MENIAANVALSVYFLADRILIPSQINEPMIEKVGSIWKYPARLEQND